MAKTETIHVRVEPEVKGKVETIIKKERFSTSEVLNEYLLQIIKAKTIPFKPTPKPIVEKKVAPKKTTTVKKTAEKKATPKKAAVVKKTVEKKVAPKKAAVVKKTVAKKVTPKKVAVAKKTTPKKAVTKK